MYQIYFHINLFNPLFIPLVINEKVLNKKAIEKLLNEILLTDRLENENRLEQVTKESDMRCW